MELNDSAIALSALVPTAPMDWVTPNSLQRAPNAEEVYTVSSTGPGKLSAGVHPRKYLPSSYDYFNRPVLHRPVELTQYTSAALAVTFD